MSENKTEWIGLAFLGIGIGVAGLFGALAAASAQMGPPAILVWVMVLAMFSFGAKSQIAKAFARRVTGSSEEQEAISDEVYAELDELRARVAEIEDRQDFSERLLSRQSSGANEGSVP